jgi:hypothetical protein
MESDGTVLISRKSTKSSQEDFCDIYEIKDINTLVL